jgi:hypothetical protein
MILLGLSSSSSPVFRKDEAALNSTQLEWTTTSDGVTLKNATFDDATFDNATLGTATFDNTMFKTTQYNASLDNATLNNDDVTFYNYLPLCAIIIAAIGYHIGLSPITWGYMGKTFSNFVVRSQILKLHL